MPAAALLLTQQRYNWRHINIESSHGLTHDNAATMTRQYGEALTWHKSDFHKLEVAGSMRGRQWPTFSRTDRGIKCYQLLRTAS